jgi:hypothetical protein
VDLRKSENAQPFAAPDVAKHSAAPDSIALGSNIESKRHEEMGNKVGERSGINFRAMASVALFCTGVWLVPAGIALHFSSHDGAAKWSHLFMAIHNSASFLFLIAAMVHVIINWKVLMHYVSARVGEYMRFKRELLIAVLGVSAFVMLVAFHALPVP